MNIEQNPKNLDQWLPFIYKKRPNGSLGKVPIFHRTGLPCNQFDPSNWLPFDAARRVFKIGDADGYGFVLTPSDPFCVIDIDHALSHPLLPCLRSYTELSVSGNGLHTWLSLTDKRKLAVYPVDGLELFTTGFITVTGKRVAEYPSMIRALTIAELSHDLGADLDVKEVATMPTVAPVATMPTATGNHFPGWKDKSDMTDQDIWDCIKRGDLTGKLMAYAGNDTSMTGETRPASSRERVSPGHLKAVSALARALSFYTNNDAPRVKIMLQDTDLAKDVEANAWGEPWGRGGETFIDHIVCNVISR